MRTFKEHILEKLKVTKFGGGGIPTYQEYFKLLDMYCASTKKGFLDLVKMYVFDNDLLPKYENDESKYICKIIQQYVPKEFNHYELIIDDMCDFFQVLCLNKLVDEQTHFTCT